MIKFSQHNKTWFTISGLLFAFSIVMIIISIAKYNFHLSVEFTGGTKIEYKVPDNLDKNAVLGVLRQEEADIQKENPKISLGNIVLQKSGQDELIVKMRQIDDDTKTKVSAALTKYNSQIKELAATDISPTVGSRLITTMLIALLVVLAIIILFLAYAFRNIPRSLNPFKFGAAAIFALIHDVVITTGLFCLLGIIMRVEIDPLFLTALLTILGYSVQDTIVVFDRFRENLRFQRRDQTLSDLADISLNQTLARSINTSLTTFITVTALFLLGGASIRYFMLALMFGIIVGTYSSIFIASPILVAWQKQRI